MSAPHTPGPWKIGERHPGRVISTVTETVVAHATFHPDDTDSPDPEESANARLIAAAPKLLAACERLYEAHDRQDEDPSDEEWAALFEILKDAIVTARGGK